jgi:hypothetical protein
LLANMLTSGPSAAVWTTFHLSSSCDSELSAIRVLK